MTCKYGDPTCPCQDGDLCHYEGNNPMNVPPEYVRNVIAINADLLEALEQAALELEEAANLLQGTDLKGSASIMRLASEKHRGIVVCAKGQS